MSYLLTLLKYIILGLELAVVSVFTFLLGLLPYNLIKGFYPELYQFWSYTFVRFLGIKEHIHQKNELPLPQQYILICNHPSGVELVWLPSLFKVVPLSKEAIKSWFIIGRITTAIGTIFVKRDEKDSRHSAIKGCMQAAKDGKSLMIFPEGGCYGKNLGPFFMGAFHISKEIGVPVLPVYVYYEEQHTYYWEDITLMQFLKRIIFKARNRNAHLFIFDAFDPSRFETPEQFHDEVYKFYLEIEKKYRAA